MNDCTSWWAGEAGDQYTARNRVRWTTRIPFWTEIIARTGARFVLEFGCNFGANLLALRTVCPELTLKGIDVNPQAVSQAKALGIDASVCDIPATAAYDLTFTCGCLIHVPPDALEATMRDIIGASRQYILAIEYEARDEEEVFYRGERGRLWKRNYGRLYEDLGLREVDSGYLKPEDGFDSCTWWCLQK